MVKIKLSGGDCVLSDQVLIGKLIIIKGGELMVDLIVFDMLYLRMNF